MREVTIAICIYNAEKYIVQSVESVVNQTFAEYDLLLLDDCSTDRGVELAMQLLEARARDYRLISLSVNSGVAAARQRALEEATTKYIIYIDADDIAHPDLLRREYEVMVSDKNIMGVDCWLEFVDGENRKLRGGLYIGATTREEYLSRAERGKLSFYPIQCLFDREAALRVGGFRLEGFPDGRPRYRDFCEDLDLWSRMSDLYVEGRYMLTTPEVLYHYRKTGVGVSSNRLCMMLKMRYVKLNIKQRRAGEREISFKEFLSPISQLEMHRLQREAEAATLLGNGVILINRGRFIGGSCSILRSICMNPRYFWQKLRANLGLFR